MPEQSAASGIHGAFMITRLSLVEMLFCCVAVDGSAICLLLTISYSGRLLSALTLR